MSFLISDALAEAPAAGAGGGDPLMGLLFPIGLVVILYFFMIRPQIKRQKEHKKLVEALGKGDEVVTMGGVVGRVTELGDDFATLEVADGVNIKIRRQSVEAVLPKGSIKEM
jgi:preprotein translocase subunit YajC